MNEYTIITREFREDDIPYLNELTNELGYPTSLDEMKQRMDVILQFPNYKTGVAICENEVIGYIGLCKNYFWEQNGSFVRIQALVVRKGFRRYGAGKKLIEYAESWARKENARLLVLNCGNHAERENAHKFYPEMGFEAKSTGYMKKLV